jgi:hypothetical protein
MDVTTYTLAEAGVGRWKRDRYKCVRCERIGVKCLNWIAGGHCNGLARAAANEAGVSLDKPLCASCTGRVGEVARSVIGWSLIGAVGGLLRPKR